jgi:DNA repair photolyase
VPNILGRFNSKYVHNDVKVNVDYAGITKDAEKLRGINKQILLSFTTDPYSRQIIHETRKVLEILNFYGHKVAILTKGGKRSLRDLDMFKQFGDRIKIGASLTFDNDIDSREWERGAVLPSERIESLRILHEEGIKTWVSFEPVIKPEQSLNLMKQVSFVDHVKVGKINNYKGLDKTIDWKKFIVDSADLLRDQGTKFYIKKDLSAYYPEYLTNFEKDENVLFL